MCVLRCACVCGCAHLCVCVGVRLSLWVCACVCVGVSLCAFVLEMSRQTEETCWKYNEENEAEKSGFKNKCSFCCQIQVLFLGTVKCEKAICRRAKIH